MRFSILKPNRYILSHYWKRCVFSANRQIHYTAASTWKKIAPDQTKMRFLKSFQWRNENEYSRKTLPIPLIYLLRMVECWPFYISFPLILITDNFFPEIPYACGMFSVWKTARYCFILGASLPESISYRSIQETGPSVHSAAVTAGLEQKDKILRLLHWVIPLDVPSGNHVCYRQARFVL